MLFPGIASGCFFAPLGIALGQFLDIGMTFGVLLHNFTAKNIFYEKNQALELLLWVLGIITKGFLVNFWYRFGWVFLMFMGITSGGFFEVPA